VCWQKGLCTKKAEFRYYEFQKVQSKLSNGVPTRRRVDGTFVEDIEMDVENGAYERINVPPILESRRSTVLHDFETVDLFAAARALVFIGFRLTRKRCSRFVKPAVVLYLYCTPTSRAKSCDDCFSVSVILSVHKLGSSTH